MRLSKEAIILRTRKKLFLALHGEHDSTLAGQGLDFREVREYSSDDDIRHLNWKITARTGIPSINRFNETKQLSVLLVYLNSGGLHFGMPQEKKQSAIEVLTALGYATVALQDRLSVLFYSRRTQLWQGPSRNRRSLDLIYETAQALDPLKQEIDFATLPEHILQRCRQRSLVFLIGDFWDFTAQSDLGRLASKHELYCVLIRDKEEETLHLRGRQRIGNPNTGKAETMLLDKRTADHYHTLVKAHDAMLEAHFRKHQIRHQKIYTHDDSIGKILQLVRR